MKKKYILFFKLDARLFYKFLVKEINLLIRSKHPFAEEYEFATTLGFTLNVRIVFKGSSCINMLIKII